MSRHSVSTGRTFSTSSIHLDVIQAHGHRGSNQNCAVSLVPSATLSLIC